jgi:hypothetical protein
LDALLLGKGGSSAIRGALRQGAKTEQEIAREQAVAKARAAALQQGLKGVAEEAKTELGKATTELKTGLETSKESFVQNEIQNDVNRVVNSLRTGGNISRKDLNLLNLQEDDFKNLRYQVGVEGAPVAADIIKSLQDYYSTGSTASFASPQQKAAIGALGQLSSQQNLGLNLLDSVYDLDQSQSAYFNLPAYKDAVEKRIQDRLVNDPVLVSQKEEIDNIGASLGDIKYQNSDVLSDIGNMFGLTGYNKLNLNNIADSINVGKTSFDSIKNKIRDWIDENKPANFIYRDSRGRVINTGRDLAYDGDPFKRKDAVANSLAELVFLKAERQLDYDKNYNQIKNTPTLSFNFTD